MRILKSFTTFFILFTAFGSFCDAVAVAPTFTKLPEPLYETVEDASVTLHCRVLGSPKPVVKWKLDGRELSSGGRYLVTSKGDLMIHTPVSDDAGRYRCFAQNALGGVSSDDSLGRLVVHEKTRILSAPDDYEVVAGQSVTIPCKAIADSNLPMTLEWQVNGQPIDFNGDDQRMQLSDDSSLTISKTTIQDSASYVCLVKTKLDNATIVSRLIVQDVPNAVHLVHVECGQTTATVEWRPMGDNQAPIRGYDIQYNTSFTPDFWEVAVHDVPAYDFKFKVELRPWANYSFRVIANNKIGPSPPSHHSSVCSTPPDVPYTNPWKGRDREDTPNTLVISWVTMPQLHHNGPDFFYRVFWKSIEVPEAVWESKDVHDWRQMALVIENQPSFQQYLIRVEAHNSIGQARMAASEFIGYSGEDVPLHSPTDVVLKELIDAQKAIVAWRPVSATSVRGHFKGYKIQSWHCEEGIDNTNGVKETLTHRFQTQVTLNSLRPFSKNCVRVLAYNDHYDGPLSNVLTIQTPEGKPSPVSSFNAVPMGPTALKLIWSPPSNPNGNLQGYHINLQKIEGTALSSKDGKKPIVVDPQTTSTRLVHLEPSTKYRVSIAAETNAGLGSDFFVEATTSHESRRRPDKPTFDLSRLETTDGLAGVRVTWHPNLDGQPGSHFYVQYRPRGDSLFQKTMDVLYEESVDVTALQPDTTYEFRVVAVDVGYNTPSDITLFGPGTDDKTISDNKKLPRMKLPVNAADWSWLLSRLSQKFI